MSVTLTPDTKRFFATLERELGKAKLTPAQAEQLRKAAVVLEGGAGVTDDHIEKVGKELKLSASQKAALRFAFVLDRVKPHVKNIEDAATNTATALRYIVKSAGSDPKLAAALERFMTSFVNPSADGTNLEENPKAKAKGLEWRDDVLWISATPPRTDRITWKSVYLVSTDARVQVEAGKDGLVKAGRVLRGEVDLQDLRELTRDSAQALRDRLDEIKPRDEMQRTLIERTRQQLDQGPLYIHNAGTYQQRYSGGTIELGKIGPLKATTPKPKKIDLNENDPGALKKLPDGKGWTFIPAKGGKLVEKDAVPLDKLSLEALLRLKGLVETRTGEAALSAAVEQGADLDVEPEELELDGLLASLALSKARSTRALYKAAESRLRDALQGMPVGKLDREVFLSLVGATTPGAP